MEQDPEGVLQLFYIPEFGILLQCSQKISFQELFKFAHCTYVPHPKLTYPTQIMFVVSSDPLSIYQYHNTIKKDYLGLLKAMSFYVRSCFSVSKFNFSPVYFYTRTHINYVK